MHADNPVRADERLVLGEGARPVFVAGVVAAVIGLGAALLLGYGRQSGLQLFYFGYLAAFAFYLSIALGALFFVLMQHLTRAGWSVSVRRLAEAIAATLPVLAILSVPLLISVAMQNGELYRWALPLDHSTPQARELAAKGETEELSTEEGLQTASQRNAPLTLDANTLQKRKWLNPWFFIVRVIGYFAIWSAMALWYRNQSVMQDQTADPQATRRMQILSGFSTVVFGLTVTGAAGDLLMSLDPHWYSTMWAVYYFAGCALCSFAVLIIAVYLLQSIGYLRRSISIEHYHDLGKYLFGFTFFWGYIAFGQYMLLWYANIPEELEWLSRHGVTTVTEHINTWSWVIAAILFGQILIPFAGLLSRHPKRRREVLLFWAIWVLAFHLLDSIWIVMPEYSSRITSGMIVVLAAAVVGMGGLLLAVFIRSLAGVNLRPTADPRLAESLAFENF